MADTRPMPRRTREDFLSLQRLCATIDGLATDATHWQVAAASARALADALAAQAVVIHQYDASQRDLRSIGVHGPNAGDLLGTTTHVDDDHVATAVLTNKKPLLLRLDGSLPRFVPDRHRVLGSSRSLAVFPVLRGDACVAILEIVGVEEERQPRVAEAAELVARRLSSAFDSLPERGAVAAEPRLVVTPSGREHPAMSVTPATFPKRGPTLLCRPARRQSSSPM